MILRTLNPADNMVKDEKMTFKSYIAENKERFLDELFALLRIPSVSADSKFKAETALAAEFIAEKLKEAGADKTEVCPTAGHPIVYAEKIINPDYPTVLVYGHYDVQPADPLNLWDSPPFEPVIKNERIYARGACDDKGQAYMHIKAFEMLNKMQNLKCNVKFMIEGEEEVGSVNLETFTKENVQKLKADVILVSDTGMIANDIPSITVGLRGLSYVEVEVTSPNRDLHSGLYGGAVANPINILCEMIAKLKDDNNHITVAGFYDDVAEMTAAERADMAQIPFKLDDYKKLLDLQDVHGEKGYTTLERASARPTLDVNGIWGGYTGEGAKTVIPSKAFAKISMRLVPNQDPDKITQLFTDYFTSLAPPSVKVKVTPHHGGYPVITPSDAPAYSAAAKAYEQTFGKKPLAVRSGGSIPIIAMFKKVLGLDSVLMGFGLDIDAIHSPNESYGLFNYFIGIETIANFYENYAKVNK
jgi:acetylornithine deacetylase/succinyl-diaminopimelate desuccinylase-like protein